MNFPDANVLLYAVNTEASHHRAAGQWLDAALNGERTVAFTWSVLLAFIRVSTNRTIFPSALSVADSLDVVNGWTSQRSAVIVNPGKGHGALLGDLLRTAQQGGNLVPDAHLAALALENRGTVVSFDRDFGRFAEVKWLIPGSA
jgi:toxin-antitoxin system PIN domain toxin